MRQEQTWTGILLEPIPPEPMVFLIGFIPQTHQRPTNRRADMTNGTNLKTGYKPKASCGKLDNQIGTLYIELTCPKID